MRPVLACVVLLATGSVATADVSNTGTYTTGFTVDVPSYYGVEPAIGLSYASTGGNGPAGVGWRLEAGSTIRRLSSSYGAAHYDQTDIFFVDGRELVSCAGIKSASCSNGGTHAFRTDTFQKVVFDDHANTWTITGRDGTTFAYVAQLGGSATTFSWGLRKVTDVHAHVVDYSYFCDGADACYLSTVSYGESARCTGATDLPAGATAGFVQLFWAPRTDSITTATGRGFETVRYILRAIAVTSSAKPVRAYQFHYSASTTDGASLLDRVEQFGSDARLTSAGDLQPGPVTRKPVRTFSAASMVSSMTPVSASAVPTNGAFDTAPLAPALPQTWVGDPVPSLSGHTVIADVDGDGRADFTQWFIDGSCSSLTISTRLAGQLLDHTETKAWTSSQPSGGIDPPTCYSEARIADLDGDGMKDLLFLIWGKTFAGDNSGTLHVVTVLSKGGGTWGTPSADQSTGIQHFMFVATPEAASCAVGDYNGDGRDDLACLVNKPDLNVQVIASLGDGTMLSLGGTSLPPDPNNARSMNQLRAIDINADGRADVVVASVHEIHDAATPGCFEIIQVGGGIVYIPVCSHWALTTGISTGTGGFQFEEQDAAIKSAYPFYEHLDILAGDIDGDGHGDLVFVESSDTGFGYVIHTAMSRGSGDTRWRFNTRFGTSRLGVAALADVDGDGASDLLIAMHHEAHLADRCNVEIDHSHKSLWVGTSHRDGTFELQDDMEAACGTESTFGSYSVQDLVSTDTNGDGKADWMSAVPAGNDIDGKYYIVEDQPSPNGNNDPRRWRRADLDGDGREDWVYVGYANPGFQVFAVIAQPDGSFKPQNATFAPTSHLEGFRVDSLHDWFAIDVGGPDGVPDGKTDIVILDDTTGTITTLLSVEGGWTRTVTQRWIPSPSQQRHWQSIDIDGDGRRDLVNVRPGLSFGVDAVDVLTLRSNGDGTWTASDDLDFIGGMTDHNLGAFRVTDFDGDGRGDLVHLETAHVATGWITRIRTLRSRGDGVFLENTQTIDQPYVDARQYVPIDINGDGRIDLARAIGTLGNPVVVSMLSVGDSTFAPFTWTYANTPGPTTWDVDDHYVPGDVDQDGKTDFYQVTVQADANDLATTTVAVLWNQPNQFAMQITSGLSPSRRDTRSFELSDLGGDGRPDLMRIAGDSLDLITLAAPAARMTEEHNGIGGRTTIDYTTSVGMKGNLPGGSVIPVVAKVQTFDDITLQLLDGTSYGYDRAVYDYSRHQVLGFEAGTTATSRAHTATTYAVDARCGSRATVTTLATPSDAVIQRTTNTFVANAQMPFACLVETVVAEQCEGTASCRQLGKTTSYDTYGNAIRELDQGDLTDPLDDRLTEAPVYPNTTQYIVARPAYRNVSAVVTPGTWQLVESTQFVYDGNSTYAQPVGAQGDLTLERRWNDLTGGYVETALGYDAYGNLATTRGPPTAHNPRGATSTIEYDCSFNRFPVKLCEGTSCSTAVWDTVLGVKKSTTDENNETITTIYDALGRPSRTDNPDLSFAQWTYPQPASWGTPDQHVHMEYSDDSGDGVHWSDTYFDALARSTRTFEEGGRTNEILYDGASVRPARLSNPYRPGDPVFWTQVGYDAANRATQTLLPDGRVRRTKFAVGTVTTIDELGAAKVATSDGFGQIAAIEEQLRTCTHNSDNCKVSERNITTYGHDVLGRLTWIRDAAGNWTTNTYDSLSRRWSYCSPDAGCNTTTYADDDLVESATDAAKNSKTLTYDPFGRVIRRESTDANGVVQRTVTYTWDVDPATGRPDGPSSGKVVEETDTSDVTVLHHHHWGQMSRLDGEHDCIDSTCVDFAYRYDHANRVAEIMYPDPSGRLSSASERIHYIYNDEGDLRAIPGYVGYQYDAAGHPTDKILANGVVEHRTFDPMRGWLDRIQTASVHGSVFDEQVTHDPNGQVGTESFATPTTSTSFTYDHDDLGRLTAVVSSDPTLSSEYHYDKLGNRTWDTNHGVIDHADPRHPHAITNLASGGAYNYDDKGQLLGSPDLALHWNAEGKPDEITDRSLRTKTYYSYDASGQRVVKTTSGGKQLSFGSLVDVDTAGRLAMYVEANGQVIARRDAAGVEFLHRDHLGSVRATTDASGAVVSNRTYGTWGDTVAAAGSVKVPSGFTGERADPENALVLLGARYYDPTVGQFVSPDNQIPDVYTPQSLNPYAYVLNDPVSLVDPTGHSPEDEPDWYVVQRQVNFEATVMPMDGTAGADEEADFAPVRDEEPPTGPLSEPVNPMATDFAKWQAQQSLDNGLSPDQQFTRKWLAFDDFVSDRFIDPAVRKLTTEIRWALIFDPTGLGELRLDQVDAERGWGDTGGGVRGRAVRGVLSMFAPEKLGMVMLSAPKVSEGITLELQVSREMLGGTPAEVAEGMRIVQDKVNRANKLLAEHREAGAIYTAPAHGKGIPYNKNLSKNFLKEMYDIPEAFSKFTIESIIGGGNVDELISRWWGGPQLPFNQHVIPGHINQYMGSVEWSSVVRQGVQEGDALFEYSIRWMPRRELRRRRTLTSHLRLRGDDR